MVDWISHWGTFLSNSLIFPRVHFMICNTVPWYRRKVFASHASCHRYCGHAETSLSADRSSKLYFLVLRE